MWVFSSCMDHKFSSILFSFGYVLVDIAEFSCLVVAPRSLASCSPTGKTVSSQVPLLSHVLKACCAGRLPGLCRSSWCVKELAEGSGLATAEAWVWFPAGTIPLTAQSASERGRAAAPGRGWPISTARAPSSTSPETGLLACLVPQPWAWLTGQQTTIFLISKCLL